MHLDLCVQFSYRSDTDQRNSHHNQRESECHMWCSGPTGSPGMCQPGWQGAPSPLPTSLYTHSPPRSTWRTSSSCQWTQPKAPFHQPRSQLPPHTSHHSPAHTLTNGQHLLTSPCLSQHLPSQTRPPGQSRAWWCGEKGPC